MTGRMLVAILVPVLLAVETMAWLADRWFADGSYFGHGPFVPITAAAWAAWIVRRERHLGGGSALPAIPVAAAAAIMLYVLHGRGVGLSGPWAGGWGPSRCSLGPWGGAAPARWPAPSGCFCSCSRGRSSSSRI